jgi:Ca-activated chloride channel family protein
MPVTDNFGNRRLIRVQVDIDEDTLTKVAEKTGAIYFRATDTASLSKIYDEINKMETTTRTIKKFESYRELFLFFVLGALLLLGLEIYQSRKKLP